MKNSIGELKLLKFIRNSIAFWILKLLFKKHTTKIFVFELVIIYSCTRVHETCLIVSKLLKYIEKNKEKYVGLVFIIVIKFGPTDRLTWWLDQFR